MFFGTFWEHHTCLYIYRVLIIKYLDAILCYSEEMIRPTNAMPTQTMKGNTISVNLL